MGKTQIIILAAGKGTRMGEGPKALTELNQKSFLEHILNTIDKIGLEDRPVVVVGYQKEKIMEKVGNVCHFVEQKEQLGTGHAVLCTENSILEDTQTIVVLYVDHPLVSQETIQAFIEKQQSTKAPILIAEVKVDDYEDIRKLFYKSGRIKKDKNGKILGVVEYKDATPEEKDIKEVAIGYFAFEAKWLWKNLKKLDNNNAQKEYYLTYLINIAIQNNDTIESIVIPHHEGVGANSKEELEVLEIISR